MKYLELPFNNLNWRVLDLIRRFFLITKTHDSLAVWAHVKILGRGFKYNIYKSSGEKISIDFGDEKDIWVINLDPDREYEFRVTYIFSQRISLFIFIYGTYLNKKGIDIYHKC